MIIKGFMICKIRIKYRFLSMWEFCMEWGIWEFLGLFFLVRGLENYDVVVFVIEKIIVFLLGFVYICFLSVFLKFGRDKLYNCWNLVLFFYYRFVD